MVDCQYLSIRFIDLEINYFFLNIEIWSTLGDKMAATMTTCVRALLYWFSYSATHYVLLLHSRIVRGRSLAPRLVGRPCPPDVVRLFKVLPGSPSLYLWMKSVKPWHTLEGACASLFYCWTRARPSVVLRVGCKYVCVCVSPVQCHILFPFFVWSYWLFHFCFSFYS